MSIRTEDTYVHWVRRFILFHHKQHPQEMGAPAIRAFLAHLALHNQVAASTQNVALNALVFLYRYVLKQAFPDLEEIERTKRPGRIPVVLTREEVCSVLGHLTGTPHLMASLLYSAGLRLMECVRLRVKDLDFAYRQITIHEGKGVKGRITILPQSLEKAFQHHLAKVRLVHEDDLLEGYGAVYLPYAFGHKDPSAATSLELQRGGQGVRSPLDPR